MINHRGTQTIHTQRLTLRKITQEDMQTIYEFMRNTEVTKYEDWIAHESIEYTRGFISWLTSDYKTEQNYCWGMQLDEAIIGFILMADVNEWNGSIAYYVDEAYWSKGYATEAVAAVMSYMFSEVNINRIEAKHSTKNTASGKVLKKAGMHYRGHVKEFEFYTSKSEWHDCDYAISKEQFFE